MNLVPEPCQAQSSSVLFPLLRSGHRSDECSLGAREPRGRLGGEAFAEPTRSNSGRLGRCSRSTRTGGPCLRDGSGASGKRRTGVGPPTLRLPCLWMKGWFALEEGQTVLTRYGEGFLIIDIMSCHRGRIQSGCDDAARGSSSTDSPLIQDSSPCAGFWDHQFFPFYSGLLCFQ